VGFLKTMGCMGSVVKPHKWLLLKRPCEFVKELFRTYLLSLIVLLDDLGEFLSHLPALRPPRLLDLAADVLMGHKLLPPSLDNTPDVLDWLHFLNLST
jgi:hypothetical protein